MIGVHCAAIAATATAFSAQMNWLHDTGSVIGTAVSALFLLARLIKAIASRNSADTAVPMTLPVSCSQFICALKAVAAWKRGEPLSDEIVSGGGVMSWLFGKTFRLVSRSC
jgi:high-affinity nickel-transport protein